MRNGPAVLAALAALALHACGGSSSGPVPIADLAAQDASAECALLARCGAVSSEAACKALLLPEIAASMSEVSAAVANGTAIYDGDKAAQCLDWLSAQTCDQSTEAVRVVPAACAETIKGAIASGGVCEVSTQCASGSCVRTGACTEACCPGTCAPQTPAPAAAGASCSGRPCADGTFCDQATLVCTNLRARGAACDGNEQCTYGTLCGGGANPVCTKAPAEGEACAAGRCGAVGLVCDKTSHCVKVASLGAACTPNQSGCAYDLACDPTTSECAPRPGAGSKCFNGGCDPGSYCVFDASGGVCAALKPNGRACNDAYECASQSCQAKFCADAGACVKK